MAWHAAGRAQSGARVGATASPRSPALRLHATGTEQGVLPFGLWCLNYCKSTQDVLKFNLKRNVKYISVFIPWEGSSSQCALSLPRALWKHFVTYRQGPQACEQVEDVGRLCFAVGCAGGVWYFLVAWWLVWAGGSFVPSSGSGKTKLWKTGENTDNASCFHK